MNATNSAHDELVAPSMIISTMILSIIGVIGNFLIVLATVLSRPLHSKCQTLIAILAASDLVVCVYLVQLRGFMFQGWYWVSNEDCFMNSIHGIFALNVQSGMGLVLGVDRMLAVAIPLRYPRLSKWIYAGMLFIVAVYATALTLKGYLETTADKVPVCLPPTAYSPSARLFWVGSSFFVAIVVLLVYLAAHIQCRMLNAGNTHEPSIERVKRLLNSLTIVVGVYFFTWFLTILALMIVQIFSDKLGKSFIDTLNQQLAWLVIINASTNFFIYFWRAPEYRRAFLFLMSAGYTRNPNQSSVVALSTVQPRKMTMATNQTTHIRSPSSQSQ